MSTEERRRMIAVAYVQTAMGCRIADTNVCPFDASAALYSRTAEDDGVIEQTGRETRVLYRETIYN